MIHAPQGQKTTDGSRLDHVRECAWRTQQGLTRAATAITAEETSGRETQRTTSSSETKNTTLATSSTSCRRHCHCYCLGGRAPCGKKSAHDHEIADKNKDASGDDRIGFVTAAAAAAAAEHTTLCGCQCKNGNSPPRFAAVYIYVNIWWCIRWSLSDEEKRGVIKTQERKKRKDPQQWREARQAQATGKYYLETSAFSCCHVLSQRENGQQEGKGNEEERYGLEAHNHNTTALSWDQSWILAKLLATYPQ